MSQIPLLELRDVSKSYGSLVVSDHVSLAVVEGEALGILGPNGAGKSTMFNLITGTVRVDTGNILFAGHEITSMKAHMRTRRGIARSYQIPKPFLHMTVFENLLVAASFATHGLPETARNDLCMSVLADAGLGAKANAPAGSLGLLQLKRLELARALAAKPRLLLLDEIAGGLTEAECHELVASIKAVRRAGVTIVWIEHVLHALMGVVDRLLVLNFGRVIAAGEPQAVMAEPAVREVYLGLEAGHEAA
jgi:branched-chain amino acid transport system ATP-binding protein